MKREVKFRGKRLDNGEWAYGNLIQHDNGNVSIPVQEIDNGENVAFWADIDPKTVGQLIGQIETCNEPISHIFWEGDKVTPNWIHNEPSREKYTITGVMTYSEHFKQLGTTYDKDGIKDKFTALEDSENDMFISIKIEP